jgi:hypothetical protein
VLFLILFFPPIQQARLGEVEENLRADLDQRYKAQKDQIDSIKEEHKVALENADQITKKIQSMFFKLQCDQIDSAKGSTVSMKGMYIQLLLLIKTQTLVVKVSDVFIFFYRRKSGHCNQAG